MSARNTIKFMVARFFALGRAGANRIDSPHRKEWESLRADLQRLGALGHEVPRV